jgi:hypothetical protein
MITDIIDREIHVDDFVVFYSNIYRVKALGKARSNGSGTVQIMIWNGGETARPVKKHSKDMAILDKNDVLIWLLRKGFKHV